MIEIIEGFEQALRWAFPSWQLGLMIFMWIAAAMFAGSMLNNQNRRTKIMNTLKVLGFAAFIESWAIIVLIYNDEVGRIYYSITLVLIAALCAISGDWLVFLIKKARLYPGGMGGFILTILIRWSKKFIKFAERQLDHQLNDVDHKLLAHQKKA